MRAPFPKGHCSHGEQIEATKTSTGFYHPGSLWDENTEGPLQENGGLTRPSTVSTNGTHRTKANHIKSK